MSKNKATEIGINRQTLFLKGLCCASCAAKIETKVKGLTEISFAQLDFATQKLTIETDVNNNGWEHIVAKIQDIVNVIEQGVDVILYEDKNKVKKTNRIFKKKDLVVLFGGIIFVIALFTDFGRYKFFVFLAAYLFIGYDIVAQAFKNILKREIFDENFLMVTATFGAFAIGEFPEAVSVMIFYKIGEYFQDRAVDKSRESISELMNIRPDYAIVERHGVEVKVAPEEVKKDEIIVVKPGEKIPLDGVVEFGSAAVDTASLTGESVHRDVGIGSEVLGGFLNINGLIKIRVKKEFAEGTASKILEMVENSASKKSKTENFITKFARYYTPFVVFAAAMIVLVPSLIYGWNNGTWLYRAMIFLVVSCPCALVISIPLTFFGGIGGAAKRGILIKGGNFLEALNKVDTVVFDKTGTLTKGIFVVDKIITEEGFFEKEVSEYAAAAELYSNHPIAKAIVHKNLVEIDKKLITEHTETAGKGIRVLYKNKEIILGNQLMMNEAGIKVSNNSVSGTNVYIAVNKKLAGVIIIKDEIRKEAKNAIGNLEKAGIKNIIMLTGDNKNNASEIAENLGIKNYFAELLPGDKVEKMEEIEKNKRGNIIFVGDGINDAPVLARADIGIAMGGIGSDAAIEAADVVIMNDDIEKIAEAIKISKKTREIVWQNIIFALGVKGIVLLLGAFGIATMWEAVFADVGVALIAVLNAGRIMKK